jgi:hypothetical protein
MQQVVLRIYGTDGLKYRELILPATTHAVVPVTGLPDGNYLIQSIIGGEHSQTVKFLKCQ